jgi:hypothetical protein
MRSLGADGELGRIPSAFFREALVLALEAIGRRPKPRGTASPRRSSRPRKDSQRTFGKRGQHAR